MTVKLPPQRQGERAGAAVADWATVDQHHWLHDLAGCRDERFSENHIAFPIVCRVCRRLSCER